MYESGRLKAKMYSLANTFFQTASLHHTLRIRPH